MGKGENDMNYFLCCSAPKLGIESSLPDLFLEIEI